MKLYKAKINITGNVEDYQSYYIAALNYAHAYGKICEELKLSLEDETIDEVIKSISLIAENLIE